MMHLKVDSQSVVHLSIEIQDGPRPYEPDTHSLAPSGQIPSSTIPLLLRVSVIFASAPRVEAFV